MTPSALPPAQTPTDAEKGTMLHEGAVNLPRAGNNPSQGRVLADVDEHVPELVWPQSLTVFDRMVRSDARIAALMQGVTRLITRRRFELDPAGADPEDVRRISEDLGVPVLGSDGPDPVRGRARFNHREHLEQALLALRYGSYWFEIVGEIVDGAWRLRKLAPRPTRTLDSVDVEPSGSLAGITQRPTADPADTQSKFIPVSHLVGYVWQREGANWYGVSMLRPVYRSFYLKDQVLRADSAQKRRNSLGIPTFNPGAEASPDTIGAYDSIGRRLGAGHDVSVTLHDKDAQFELKGVSGTLPNPLESARYHDEEYAAAFLAMWMQLGQTQSGSRALGDTFLDVFNAALDAIADDWYCGVVNEYVIRKWMALNYGPDTDRAMPRLTSRRVESPELLPADLALLVEKNIIRPSAELERHVNGSFDLPQTAAPWTPPVREGADVQAERDAPTGVRSSGHIHEGMIVHAAALDDGPTTRQRWRELTDREVRAAIDPSGMDQRWRDAVARLVAEWGALRAVQIDSLREQIIAAEGDRVALTQIVAPVIGRELLVSEMRQIASASIGDVRREARAQDIDAVSPEVDELDASLRERADATATMIAQGLQQSASRNALRLTGGSMTPEMVAQGVVESLEQLSDAGLADQLQGALTQTQNEARALAMSAAPQPLRYVATEIMDLNTCAPCAGIDGREYRTLAEAELDYPSAGYVGCEGGDRCRGFLFAEYETDVDRERRG